MKGLLNYTWVYNQINLKSFYNSVQYEHSWFINNNFKFDIIYSYKFKDGYDNRYYGLGMSYYF